MPEQMGGLTTGRMVHYCLTEPYYQLDSSHFAAIVSAVRGDKPAGTVDLHVLVPRLADPVWVVFEVPYSAEPAPGTWHWIEKA
jgi:hypothetical protein